MNHYFRILSFGKPYKLDAVLYFICALLATLFGLLNYTLLIPLLQVLFDPENAQQTNPVTAKPSFEFSVDYLLTFFNYYFQYYLDQYGKVGGLKFVCAVIVVSVLLSNIFRYLSQRIMGNLKARVIGNLRKSIFYSLVNMEIGFFTHEKKGDIMSRVTNDVQEIETSVVHTFSTIFRDPITIIATFFYLYQISGELTNFVLVYMPISALLLAEVVRRIKKKAKKTQAALGEILGMVDETMSGIRIIKGFVAEKFILGKFDNMNERYRSLFRSMSHKREIASPLSEFLGVCLVTGILLYGGMLILNGTSDLSSKEFIPFIFILAQILVPIKALSNSFSNIQRGLIAGERIFTLLDRKPVIIESPKAIEFDGFRESIEYRNLSFAYNEEPVLRNIDLTIEKGKTIALVGPSGGGKSTLADLLPRFYDPNEGEILIDGVPIRNCTLSSLRKQMGIVTQESILFNDSIFNNIAFGMPQTNPDDVIRAAKIANAHDFIMQTEDGYETVIGERGMKLSGGQRQRLSIARAVLKNPPILILDEATSALDNESEKLVQEALTNLMKNRTSIVIAHRLSTIQHADEIIVIEKGRIIERGRHDELILSDGLYRKLHGAYTE